MILNSKLTGEYLLQEITKLLSSKEKLQKMAKASKALGHPEAASKITAMILSMVKA